MEIMENFEMIRIENLERVVMEISKKKARKKE